MSIKPLDVDVDSPANLLTERLSEVVKEHYSWLTEQVGKEHHHCLTQPERSELESLRLEVFQLRGELSRFNPEAAFSHPDPKAISLSVQPTKKIDEPVPEQETPRGTPGNDVKEVPHLPASFENGKESSGSAKPSSIGKRTRFADMGSRSSQDTGNMSVANMSSREHIETPWSSSMSSRSHIKTTPWSSSGVEYTYTPSANITHHDKTMSMTSKSISNVYHEADTLDLHNKFLSFDPEKRGYIDISAVAEQLTQHVQGWEKEERMKRYTAAIYKLNKQLGVLFDTPADQITTAKSQIRFSSFRVLMLEDPALLHEHFGPDVGTALIEIRQGLVQDVIAEQIARKWRVSETQLRLQKGRSRRWRSEHTLKVLDPLVGIMIILNALQIGMSLDWEPDWDGWFVVETVFTFFFLFEFLFCIWVRGWAEHFLGDDWNWSIFDFLIVCSAVCDTVITLLSKLGVLKLTGFNLNHLFLLRLVRLIRITRLIRILRLKLFKELTLMVNGVIAGLRTLFWAIVLLTIFIYALGVVMRQVMDPLNYENPCSRRGASGHPPEGCNRGDMLLHKFGETMFGSVVRSMLTIFVCFTDGCASPDGTPLIWHLWDSHGSLLVLGYVISFLFVSFGVLNLIMAVFVENTLASAEKTDAERQFGEASNHVKKAHELHILLGKFCQGHESRIIDKVGQKGLRRFLQRIWFLLSPDKRSSDPEMNSFPVDNASVCMRVTQDQFEEMLQDEKVHELLDDLDISCISRQQLFDILDADGNGYLAISELVNGIMKLRGPADKGDGVATVLMVRQLQKQLGKVEEHLNKRLQAMEKRICKVDATLTSPDASASMTL